MKETLINDRHDNTRIRNIKALLPPVDLIQAFPASERVIKTVSATRKRIHDILSGTDDRLLVVVGPCSIHDVVAAKDYAARLLALKKALKHSLEIVMRVYFEKPRTTVGWKGLINDPYMDGSFKINEGLAISRKLLVDLNEMGLPAAGEFLDMITPQYVADLMSWGAIGARTTESQVHRELASGISCPVGFKNGTDGSIRVAIDAIKAAGSPHYFLSVNKYGRSAIIETCGNDDCHIILRGGKTPNYTPSHINALKMLLKKENIPARLMIDCSHANSNKQFQQQLTVADSIMQQLSQGEQSIIGIMIESHLEEGSQQLKKDKVLIYGKSITDGCIGWKATENLLYKLADSIEERRKTVKKFNK